MKRDRPTALRVGLVVLLLWGAYWAALPWLNCVTALPAAFGDLLRVCTIGFGFSFLRGTGPYYVNLVIGLLYLAAAVALAVSKRKAL